MKLIAVTFLVALMAGSAFSDSCLERLENQKSQQNNGSNIIGKTGDIFEKAGSGIFKKATGRAATASILLVSQEIASGKTVIPATLEELRASSLYNANAKRFLELRSAYEGYEGSTDGLSNQDFAQKVLDLDTKLEPASGFSVFCKVSTIQNGRNQGKERFKLRDYSKKKVAKALVLN